MDHKAKAELSPLIPYILAGCTAVSVLSTDLLTPSIPSLPKELGTTIGAAQLTVGINLAAYSIAQLFHGPLSDRIGRRSLLIFAFVMFTLVSAASAYAWSIESLLVGRFLQGLFSSVPSVVVVLIIRELYGSKEALSVMALYGAVMGIAPAVGPLIGGYLHVWFGWSAGFWAIAGMAAFMALAVARFVPESKPSSDMVRPRTGVINSYLLLLSRGGFLRLAFALSLSFGAYFAYVATAPAIFIDKLGLPEHRYGLTYLIVIIAFISGNILAGKVSKTWSGHQMLVVAMRIKLFAMALLLLTSAMGIETIFSILSSMVIYAVGFALMMAAGPIVLLDQVPDLPQGPASAVLGSLQLGAAAVAGIISALLYSGSAVSLAATMGAFVLMGAFCLYSAGKYISAAPVAQE